MVSKHKNLRFSCGFHNFPVVFPWFAIILSISYGFSYSLPSFYQFPMGFPIVYHHFINFLWVFLWFSYGFSVFPHGFRAPDLESFSLAWGQGQGPGRGAATARGETQDPREDRPLRCRRDGGMAKSWWKSSHFLRSIYVCVYIYIYIYPYIYTHMYKYMIIGDISIVTGVYEPTYNW